MNSSVQSSGQADTIKLDLPASHRHVNVLEACIDAMLMRIEGLADAATLSYAVQLAVHEACTNIIDHAYAGREGARIQAEVQLLGGCPPKQIVIELHDTGVPFDETIVPKPNLDEPHEHGYGLYLMHSLMDEITFAIDSSGNFCRLTKHLG
jgi:serine/threonine-protein kinase RsbW